jgi:general stress protein 26
MSMRDKLRENPRAALFAAFGQVRAGMLGVEGTGQHMQPMTHFPDADTGEIWFITSLNSDLVRAVGLGAQAQYCIMTPEQDFHACMSGPLEQIYAEDKLDEIWSPALSAWFKDGKEDKDICMLRLTLDEASIWASTNSSIIFAVEIARANLAPDHAPDIGEHRIIQFGRAA